MMSNTTAEQCVQSRAQLLQRDNHYNVNPFISVTLCSKRKRLSSSCAKQSLSRGPEGGAWTARARAISQSDSMIKDSGPLTAGEKNSITGIISPTQII